ncbi:protoporphyrinogen oxidase [Anoplophora glabripennis]|uniref:protoporphyrinogen oxidase n=1 Tax=Anoplophora glabripennis TaxID=217634 RepID=UPI0008748540|nr:protoporphyrinogen oxidase [Anoplophora glabripennis]
MSRVILGGGITGLSSAYYLSKNLPSQPTILVEASDRLGGWIKSDIVNDKLIFEQSARTLRPGGPNGINTLSMIEDLGISDQILPITIRHPATRNRMIYSNGRLHSLPSSISSMFTTQPPFSKPLIRYLMQDLVAVKKTVKDESIYNFVNRRFGTEFADYLISPLVSGICAGDAKEISVRFLMKTLFEYEQEHGSISKGIIRNVFTKSNKSELQGLSLKAKKEKWQIYSFKKGLETLPKAMSDYIKKRQVNILLNSRCNQLEFLHDGVLLHFGNGQSLKTSHVVSSIPSESLGSILRGQHPVLANLLSDIKSVTVGVVNLCYKGNIIKNPGFGFLIPPKENLPILGVIYDSCSFPRSDDTVLTVMMGGWWFTDLFGKNPHEDVLLQTAREQVGNILGILEKPTHSKVKILKNCIPQYVVGHSEKIDKVQIYISEHKLPLSICGASYFGVGVNDVIMSAKNAVNNLLSTSH